MTEPSDTVVPNVDSDGPPEPAMKRLAKGCGCVTGMLTLGLGILIIGDFDSGAWASALGAVVISYLVFNLSGVNGFWEK